MNNFSKIQERHIAANKYRFECQNVTDMKCECGQPSSEHRYGTAECLGCDSCKKFKREMKNASAYIYVGDKVKLKSEPDTTWTVTDFAGDTYVLRGPKGSRQARLDQLERVSL